MSTKAKRKIIRDMKSFVSESPEGIYAAAEANDILHWHAIIFGPPDTIWEGGTFTLNIKFTEEYPKKPPNVVFITPVFHPNVYTNGNICLDLLQNNWHEAYTLASLLTSIRLLLITPNPDSPANKDAAELYKKNRSEYRRRVRLCVRKSLAFGIDREIKQEVEVVPSKIEPPVQDNSKEEMATEGAESK